MSADQSGTRRRPPLRLGAHMSVKGGLPCALDRVLARRPSDGAVVVLLENTAGQGSNLGHRFEQLGQILERTAPADRIGICFDTCHAVAAGYELDSARSYRSTMDELDRTVGLSRVGAFHLNDSKFGVGSRKDRHEHIGQGFVGLDGFRRLLRDRRFDDLPMVMETPKGVDAEDDRRNLAILRSLPSRGRQTR